MPRRLRLGEVGEPTHPLVEQSVGLLGGGGGERLGGVVRFDVRLWPDGKPIGHRFTPLGEHALPAGITESDESVREGPGDRRPRPRAVLAGDAVETRHAVGTRLGDADDPLRPRRLEALGELGPRRVDHRLVAVGAGAGGPVVLGGGDLALGERRFVEIDMQVVRVDAHPQMGGRRRGGEEARLDAHGQQGNRHVGSEPGDPVVELAGTSPRRTCHARRRSRCRFAPTRR